MGVTCDAAGVDGSQHEGGRRARLALLGHGAERTGPPIMLGHLLRGLAAAGRWDLSVLVARDGPLLPEYRRTGARATALTSAREPLEPLAAAMRRTGLGAPPPGSRTPCAGGLRTPWPAPTWCTSTRHAAHRRPAARPRPAATHAGAGARPRARRGPARDARPC
ncbi:MAG: hypothetical protein R2746_15865 [Acidimicrobiales bacterium]